MISSRWQITTCGEWHDANAHAVVLVMLATATDRELAKLVQYLKKENGILRKRLPKRVIVTDKERRQLLRFGKPIGKAIKELISIVSSCTLLYWVNDEKRETTKRKKKRKPGRPRTAEEIRKLVINIAKENGWGYGKVHGELKKLGITTGSGKTLTSFKASTLLKDDPNIDKCLFVVDRKDLDHQTREEFNKFQEGCVEENTNTESHVRRLVSDDRKDKVIVCTIQKLGIALNPSNARNYFERLEPLRDKRMVFIFDECHRSQFGEGGTTRLVSAHGARSRW